MDVNPGRMMDLVSALDYIEIGNRSDFFFAARTLLVHEREDLELFDEAFDLFWRKPIEENWGPVLATNSSVSYFWDLNRSFYQPLPAPKPFPFTGMP